jgi:hypothetical protein
VSALLEPHTGSFPVAGHLLGERATPMLVWLKRHTALPDLYVRGYPEFDQIYGCGKFQIST